MAATSAEMQHIDNLFIYYFTNHHKWFYMVVPDHLNCMPYKLVLVKMEKYLKIRSPNLILENQMEVYSIFKRIIDVLFYGDNDPIPDIDWENEVFDILGNPEELGLENGQIQLVDDYNGLEEPIIKEWVEYEEMEIEEEEEEEEDDGESGYSSSEETVVFPL